MSKDNNINKIQFYKDKLKEYDNACHVLEKKKLVIDTNIENKIKIRNEILAEIKNAGFEPEELEVTINELRTNIDSLIVNIEKILSEGNAQ